MLTDIAAGARTHCLDILGAFHTEPADNLPGGAGTVVLLGPSEPGFWRHVNAQPEWQDGAPDPLDRWSARAIGELASGCGGQALFPSDGPPYWPFYQWALRSGRAFVSPVTMLVHDRAGLFVSYRGAIALPERIALPTPPSRSPCDTCAGKPCLAACPVGALAGNGYDVSLCHAFLDSADGKSCLSMGCQVRRACPLSQAYGRLPEQSAYHMGQFHK
ncbi:MAG: ferredoxin [Rhodobacteraceae bacterium]|nr:ferredoxin [Paracoccaceae bacterium]MCP5341107.1 ferredoxin [Paracoccaceae bacterium]